MVIAHPATSVHNKLQNRRYVREDTIALNPLNSQFHVQSEDSELVRALHQKKIALNATVDDTVRNTD